MGDLFYTCVREVGRLVFWACTKPVVLHAHHARRDGPFLIAANHTSPYDIAILMRHIPRLVDFVSITEVFKNPIIRTFYGAMNAFPLDRSRPDVRATRTIMNRLSKGRAVALFPEGGFRTDENSVFATRRIQPGVGRLAAIANVPIVPCVILGSERFKRPSAWLPIRRTPYAIAFGEPVLPGEAAAVEAALISKLLDLRQELMAASAVRAG